MISPNNERQYIYMDQLNCRNLLLFLGFAVQLIGMSDYHALHMNVNVDGPLVVLPGQYHLSMIVETPFLVLLICCAEYPGRENRFLVT